MARKATGSIYFSRERWYARVILDKPRNYQLPEGFNEDDAEARKVVLASLALALRDQPAVDAELGNRVLARVAGASEADLPVLRRWAESLARGERKPAELMTMGELARQWTSGELARQFPDRVAAKKSVPADVSRLEHHILLVVGPDGVAIRDLPVCAFTLDHGEAILRALRPAVKSDLRPALQVGTRRHVAAIVRRLLSLAVYPLRILTESPLPKSWLPVAGPRKALGWLYPDEDRALLGCEAVPLWRRLLWGFLAREGCRTSEACGLEISDVDCTRGTLTLDKNKTNDPRAWKLTPGVPEAIELSLRLRGVENGWVFVKTDGDPIVQRNKLAEVLREDLRRAGLTRPELFERSSVRLAMRVHDLRGTFVTLASAHGRNEAWIMDRTGHGTSGMLQRYRRAIRLAQELGLGELDRLDDAIPELRALKAAQPPIVGAIVGGSGGGAPEQRDTPGMGAGRGWTLIHPLDKRRTTLAPTTNAAAGTGRVARRLLWPHG